MRKLAFILALFLGGYTYGQNLNVSGYITADSISIGAINYTDTYWEDLRVPLQNSKLNPTKTEPAFEAFVNEVYAYAFDAGNDSVESLHFIAQLPHNRKAGTDLGVHIHWAPSTTHVGNVRWKMAYTLASQDGVFPGTAFLWTTVAAGGTANKHLLTELGTIDGSALGLSSVLVCRVTRLGDHAADTFTGIAFAFEIDLHYTIDSPGSPHEYVK